MGANSHTPGITAGRLDSQQYEENFSDLHAPLNEHEALVAADRCYFCYDAPCVTACPTSIDIPLFIRQIATDTAESAAQTIFDQNILGGMCARVCPTETLCEEACVREAAEGQPVQIGRLQRFATDQLMDAPDHPYKRAAETGKTVAVVGAGPAGLACAHRLAMYGHTVTLYDSRPKGGGLNEYGIASYKSPNNFAQREVDWLLEIGGISLKTGVTLGDQIELTDLQAQNDAVFLAIGLGGVNALHLPNENLSNVLDAVDFIGDLRQSPDLGKIPIGRNVVVIGGGMTAIDAAVQAKLLGAQNVAMVYRRDQSYMGASQYEQDLATKHGVQIIYNAQPIALHGDGKVTEVEFAYTQTQDGALVQLEETFTLDADQVFKAIGQNLLGAPLELTLEGKKIKVDETGKTSDPKIWAGGDCATGGDDLTVTAVAEGRDAAEAIHANLMGHK